MRRVGFVVLCMLLCLAFMFSTGSMASLSPGGMASSSRAVSVDASSQNVGKGVCVVGAAPRGKVEAKTTCVTFPEPEHPGDLALVYLSASVSKNAIDYGETLSIHAEMEYIGPVTPILGRPVVIIWNSEWGAINEWFINEDGNLVDCADPEPYCISVGDSFVFDILWDLRDCNGLLVPAGEYRIQATIDSPVPDHPDEYWLLVTSQGDMMVYVRAAPILSTAPDPPSHDFGDVPKGQTRSWTFNITNSGTETLTWNVSYDQPWIAASPASGSTTTETDTVTVAIDTTGLECDVTYTGTITITSNDGTKNGTITVAQNMPPATPSNPSPPNHATGVSVNADLSWTGGDPDTQDTVTYDVCLGTTETPPLKATVGPYPATQSSINYDPGVLVDGTTYYWKIAARDNHGITREGPVWDFTVGQPGPTETWNLPYGLDADPASVNIWTYPEHAVTVALTDVDSSMPAGLLIWHYGGPTDGWLFCKKGWGAVNTLETLIPGKGYIGIVPTASVWEIPQG